MLNSRSLLRSLILDNEFYLKPSINDPLSARIAEVVGYKLASLGGYNVGAVLCTPEPLITMNEMVMLAKYTTSAASIPILADVGAGYGDPLHVVRTVRELEKAGAAGMIIEDQVFPKRAHYHRDYKEHVISAEEMCKKIEYACKARSSKDFIIIGRTDSLRTDGFEEAVRRAKLYVESGVQMFLVFPNNIEEARLLPGKIDVPTMCNNSPGNRIGRPILTAKEAKQMGYKMLSTGVSTILSQCKAVKDALSRYLELGEPPSDQLGEQGIRLRQELENDILDMTSLYSIEEDTTEQPSSSK